MGGLRQQFSLTENIQMSLFGAEFIRTLPRRFGPNANVFFTPHGYLLLANEEHAPVLADNSKLQRQLGAVNELLTKDQLKKRFPWLEVSDVELGCLGLEKEGWFDPWSLLSLLKHAAQEKGVRYVHGEAVDFSFKKNVNFYVDDANIASFEGLDEVVVNYGSQEAATHSASKYIKLLIILVSFVGETTER